MALMLEIEVQARIVAALGFQEVSGIFGSDVLADIGFKKLLIEFCVASMFAQRVVGGWSVDQAKLNPGYF